MQDLLLCGGLPRIAFAEPQAGRLQRRRAEASPGDELELMGQRIQQQDVSRVHPELAANLLEQHLQGHAQVQTAGDRLIDCVQGAQPLDPAPNFLHRSSRFGNIHQAAIEVDFAAFWISDHPGCIAYPNHPPIEAAQLDFILADLPLSHESVDLFLPFLRLYKECMRWCLHQSLQIGEAQQVGHGAIGFQDLAFGGGTVEPDRHPLEEIAVALLAPAHRFAHLLELRKIVEHGEHAGEGLALEARLATGQHIDAFAIQPLDLEFVPGRLAPEKGFKGLLHLQTLVLRDDFVPMVAQQGPHFAAKEVAGGGV